MGNLSNQDDAAEIRLAPALPPGCKRETPARLCLQFVEYNKNAPANTQEADNADGGNLTPMGQAFQQGRQQIKQRQIDEALGFRFNDHSEWKEWDEKQPPADANGRRN